MKDIGKFGAHSYGKQSKAEWDKVYSSKLHIIRKIDYVA